MRTSFITLLLLFLLLVLVIEFETQEERDNESFFDDKALGDLRAVKIKFMRPVRPFAEQSETRVPDQLKQRIVAAAVARQRLRNLRRLPRVTTLSFGRELG
jgi:hypothetical protein